MPVLRVILNIYYIPMCTERNVVKTVSTGRVGAREKERERPGKRAIRISKRAAVGMLGFVILSNCLQFTKLPKNAVIKKLIVKKCSRISCG